MSKFIVYGSPGCIFCQKAKEVLQNAEIEFEYRDIAENMEWRSFILEQGFRTVPQIYGPSGRHIGGYEDLIKEL